MDYSQKYKIFMVFFTHLQLSVFGNFLVYLLVMAGNIIHDILYILHLKKYSLLVYNYY